MACYDIIRFVDHQQSCHRISDNVEGTTLADYLREKPQLSTRELRVLLNRIIKELADFHKCRETGFFKYVNPYGIIRTHEGEIFLLDLSGDSNREILALMRRRAVREQFQPPNNSHYQTSSLELDLFGLGKVIQYILANVEITGGLTGTEEHKYRIVIKKCLTPSFSRKIKDISQINTLLPKNNAEFIRKFVITCAGILVLAGGFMVKKTQAEAPGMRGEKMRIARDMADKMPDLEEVEKAWEKGRENVFVTLIETEGDLLLKDKDSAGAALYVGELLWPEIKGEENRYKVTAFMAAASRQAEEKEKSEMYHEDLLRREKDPRKREEIHQVLAQIREEKDDSVGAAEVVERENKENSDE